MNDYLVWSPLYKVDRTKYLYHYTSVEKAFKILYYKTLQFANITTTNDIFEQKPKLSFDETDLNTFDMVRTIQKYFLKEQKRVRIHSPVATYIKIPDTIYWFEETIKYHLNSLPRVRMTKKIATCAISTKIFSKTRRKLYIPP